MNENKSDQPLKTKPNEHIDRHGPMGFMILRLNRFAILGWVFGFVILIFFGLYIIIDKFQPVPVIAIDAAGRVLGTFEYLDPTVRTDEELIAASKYFLERYLSLNSSTIYNDYAAALSMMTEDLKKSKLEEIKLTGYLPKIEKAHSRSFNEYSKGQKKIAIIAKKGLNAAIRLRGDMIVTPENGKILERPFDITLDIKVISRNTLVTTGIQITNITGN